MLCVVKTLIGWFVLMIAGTNLIGLIVRGIVSPQMQKMQELATAESFLAAEVARDERANLGVTLLFGLVAVLYLCLLFYFWNVGVTLAAGMLMMSRLPDLLWEIHTGQKVQKAHIPQGAMRRAVSLLAWAALPVLWFSLCYGGR